MITAPSLLSVRPGYPDFLDLPWNLPLGGWMDHCCRLEQVPRGLSRHPVVFVNYDGVVYALKEMPLPRASQEFEVLRRMEELHLPAVAPVGYAQAETSQGQTSVLITRYLDQSLPYRMLFMSSSLKLYRKHLLDAVAGLMVQLHLAGVYWGDCSLSNTLYRRDAGTLRAYLVDAETSEIHPGVCPPTLRFHDLERLEESINGDILDLQAAGELALDEPGVPAALTGSVILKIYQALWDEITHDVVISPNEHYRIQERIRALNALGFSVGGVELMATQNGDQLRLRVAVADRNFYRDQLHGLTGLDVEEMQAQKMMNEIQEVRATLSRTNNRSTPLSVAAYHWLEHTYGPAAARLQVLVDEQISVAELYCQMLENKWYLSERAQRDVGHQAATEDYIQKFGKRIT